MDPLVGGISGLTMRVLNGHLNKITGMSNWAKHPYDDTQLQYAAFDASVLIAIINVTHNEHDWRSQVESWRSSLKDIKKYCERKIQNQNISDVTNPTSDNH